MKGRHHPVALRLGITVVALIAGFATRVPDWSLDAGSAQAVRALPGPVDEVYADPANLMYRYGPTEIERSSLQAVNAFTSNITVTYDAGFAANPPAQAAFQAAVDIWKSVISSPAPIRVNAAFKDLGNPSMLGSAGPSRICTTNDGIPHTGYPAALADKLDGSSFCAAIAPPLTSEIVANFNSTFTNWDYGTSGTPVSNKYSFMTVVLHELGHGLGFRGTMTAVGGNGSFGYTPSILDIFDRFSVTGAGAPLIGFANPSSALGAQLVSNNTFVNGPNAALNNSGSWPKLETHNFNTFYGMPTADNGFLAGSSYSHLDDVLYTGTPNGLMTWRLAQAEVYTDPGPIVRGMFADLGWTITSNCSYSLSSVSFNAGPKSTMSSVNVTAGAGCGWTAVSNANWIAIASGNSGTGNGTVSYVASANTGGVRIGTLTIAGQSFTVTQAARGRSGDFDGDGKADLTVFRPSNGTWFVLQSGTNYTIATGMQWGNSLDKPVPGDYDGDGRTDIAIFRPSNGTWFIQYSGTGTAAGIQWGNGNDVPVPGDYDGDGKTDIAIFRPSNGTWFIEYSGTGTAAGIQWGNGNDVPVPGDYDGDGKTDIAIFRPSNGTWFLQYSGTGTAAGIQWGNGNDVAVPGDYDGDGKTDIAIFRPSSGTWFIVYSGTGTAAGIQWGNGNDVPVPGDYDGDGKTDIAVFRPSNGTWFLQYSGTGTAAGIQWGNGLDVPILKRP